MKRETIERESGRGQRRLYNDVRLKAKAANQRMLRLEREGIKSPAYLAAQAKLEVLGKKTKGDRGRRFSETGKATYNEMEIMNKILDEFLQAQTSTVASAKRYQEDIYETADKNNGLSEAGISKEEWSEFWESMPDRKDRLYGSSQIVAMIRAYSMKNAELEDEDKLSMAEIAEEIQNSKNLKDAYKSLGITYNDVKKARIEA